MEKCEVDGCAYSFNTNLAAEFQDFSKNFEVSETDSGSVWALGFARCKRCGVKVEWVFEEFIHSKLFLTVVKDRT